MCDDLKAARSGRSGDSGPVHPHVTDTVFVVTTKASKQTEVKEEAQREDIKRTPFYCKATPSLICQLRNYGAAHSENAIWSIFSAMQNLRMAQLPLYNTLVDSYLLVLEVVKVGRSALF